MKIIVGGAGNVGKSIVSYLSRGNNDIVVIDEDERLLNEVAKEWDVMPLLGSVAHPDILQKAEAGKSDLLIAAADNDEVNMIACQAAYSLFNIHRKVARISARVYHKAAWGGLFGDHDIPVDLAFSPEYEIASAIKRVLQYPGMSSVYPFAGKKVALLSFRCPKKCPLLQIPLNHLERADPDLHIAVINIIRNGKGFIPDNDDTFHAGDEVNLLALTDEIEDVIVRQLGIRDVFQDGKLPFSTLWKGECTPTQAINEFESALLAYNTEHEGSRAYGKAVAFCGNKYAAIDKRR